MNKRTVSIQRLSYTALAVQLFLAALLAGGVSYTTWRLQSLEAEQDLLASINEQAVALLLLAGELEYQESPRARRQWAGTVDRITGTIARLSLSPTTAIDELVARLQRLIAADEHAQQAVHGRSDRHRRLHLVLAAQQLTVQAGTMRRQLTDILHRDQNRLVVVLIAVLAAILAFQAASAHVIRSRIVRPLEKLLPIVTEIGKGELQRAVPSTTIAEFKPLTHTLENMRQDLRDTTVSRNSLRAEVIEREKAERHALKLLEELKAAQHNMIQLEKLSALGVFVGGVAHEIGNPLMAIDNYLSYVGKRVTVEKHQVLLNKARGEVERISRIVRDLLMYVRNDTSSESSSCMFTEVQSVLHDRFDATFRNHSVTLAIESGAVLSPLDIGQDALIQVLTNLLGNALDAVKQNPTGEVSVSVAQFGNKVEIAVADNGDGIAPEARSKIFDPFFTTKPPGEGTGLGLGISRQLVEQAGGALHLEESSAAGTRFKIELNVAEVSTGDSASYVKVSKEL